MQEANQIIYQQSYSHIHFFPPAIKKQNFVSRSLGDYTGKIVLVILFSCAALSMQVREHACHCRALRLFFSSKSVRANQS